MARQEHRVTWAVTIDFHNTIARCDAWFQLEVYDLIPAFLEWYAAEDGRTAVPGERERGQSLYRTIRRRVMDTGIERDAASCVAEVMDDLRIPVSDADIERGLHSLFRPTLDEVEPMPGAVETVRQLHQCGLPMMVVSSAAYHPFLEWTLDRFGILDHFDGILTSADCGHYKSSPKIYELAAAMLARDPMFCIHVGDSEEFDIQSSQRAGLRAVLVDWDGAMAGRTAADLRVKTLEGLPAKLVELTESVPDAV